LLDGNTEASVAQNAVYRAYTHLPMVVVGCVNEKCQAFYPGRWLHFVEQGQAMKLNQSMAMAFFAESLR
jgi:hypothetical protein